MLFIDAVTYLHIFRVCYREQVLARLVVLSSRKFGSWTEVHKFI